ncbi:hypothetical protein ABNR98_004462 [Salmonella enterica]
MNKETLKNIGELIFGKRWQTDIAKALGVDSRVVRFWSTGEREIPLTQIASLKRLLKSRKNCIDDALNMITEKFLMNPKTGTVDTEENWLAEMPNWEATVNGTPELQFASLIEVEKDENGDWVEI